jgi:hypothetical protein
MAIGPEVLDGTFLKEVEEFEKIIDMRLRATQFSNGRNRVRIESPTGMTMSHYGELYWRYIKAGWKFVSRDYGDQRDPCDDLVFEK